MKTRIRLVEMDGGAEWQFMLDGKVFPVVKVYDPPRIDIIPTLLNDWDPKGGHLRTFYQTDCTSLDSFPGRDYAIAAISEQPGVSVDEDGTVCVDESVGLLLGAV